MKKLLFFFAALVMSVASAVAQDWTDQGSLKVSPAMVDGDFVDGTVFYQIQNKASGYLSTASMSGSSLEFTTSGITADAARWAIFGNSTDGFQFVNKATKKAIGMNKFTVTNQENQASATASYMTDLSDANSKFAIAPHKYTDGYFVITAADDHYFFWNQLTTLGYWYSGEGYNYGYYGWKNDETGTKNNNKGDNGASFKFNEVETLVISTFTFVLPEGVTVSFKGKDYSNGESVSVGAISKDELTITPEAADGYHYEVTIADGKVTVELVELFPNPAKQYIIGNAAGDKNLYIVLAPGDDSQGDSSNATQASFAVKAGATPFTFTPSGNGYILSTDDEGTTKYLGANGGWNVGLTQQTVWTLVEQSDGTYALNRGGSNNLGSDNLAAGKGLYTDKPVEKNGKWFLEEYVAPAESHKVTVYLDGAAEGKKMQPGEDGEYVATLIGLTAGDHSVSVAYDSEAPVSATFTSTEKNDKITVHYKDGKITFENDVVTIEIGATGYATLYSDRDLNFAYTGVEAYVLTADGENPEHLTAVRVETAKACTGLVLKGTANTKYEFLHLTNDQTATSVLSGVLVDTPVTGNELVLGVDNEAVGFYRYTGATLAAGKAYYELPTAGSVARVLVDFDGTLTSIDFNAIAAPATSEIFDLQGRRVMNAQKGLFIMNGKKVIR